MRQTAGRSMASDHHLAQEATKVFATPSARAQTRAETPSARTDTRCRMTSFKKPIPERVHDLLPFSCPASPFRSSNVLLSSLYSQPTFYAGYIIYAASLLVSTSKGAFGKKHRSIQVYIAEASQAGDKVGGSGNGKT